MGFDDLQETIYCYVMEGKIVHKDGSGQLFEKKSVSGLLVDAFVKPDGKYGPEFHIVLSDGDLYHLQVFLNSGYAGAFLCIMKNISPAIDLTIKPAIQLNEEGKKKQTLFLYQNGKALKWYFKKDTNGLPPPEWDILTDKDGNHYEGWSYKKQTDFLLDILEREIKPLLIPNKVVKRNANVSAVQQPVQRQWTPAPLPPMLPTAAADDINDHMADDLPF